MRTPRIGLIGDYDPNVIAHRAIPGAIELAAASLCTSAEHVWIPTEEIGGDPGTLLAHYDGLWCVPASPYRSTEGALNGIRYARERGVPFLGTCGGFQHALLEFARNVLGLAQAAHAELDPAAPEPLINRLVCALVEQEGTIRLQPGSRAQRLCESIELRADYHCSFGLNSAYESAFESAGMAFTGRDPAGEVRVAELGSHPFYLATLFQPERSALRGEMHPLVRGFVAAVAGRAGLTRAPQATEVSGSPKPVKPLDGSSRRGRQVDTRI